MTNIKSSNPLQGLKLETLLTEISDHYGWEVLNEALQINRFQFHTGMKSTAKFLRINQWAREKVENFYLYQFKNLPFPDDKQLAIPPRNRKIFAAQQGIIPAEITPEVLLQIEKAERARHYQVAKSTENAKQTSHNTEEPPYDPSNPWNR